MAQYINMKQIPNGIVTAKDDRIMFDSNIADCGIIYGCEINYLGNNMIHINAGYGVIKGGLFEMEDHTEYVDFATSGVVKGQIYLHLDLSADDKLIIVKETNNSQHQMVQNENANFENGIYEFQLCSFEATVATLQNVIQTFNVVSESVIDSLEGINANSTAGLKAGALAVKELNTNFNTKVPSSIEGFSVGEDGKPYITYKVGADSVRKKLGNARLVIPSLHFHAKSNFGAQSYAGSNGEYWDDYAIVIDATEYESLSIGDGRASASFIRADGSSSSIVINGANNYDISEYVTVRFYGSSHQGPIFNSESWGGGTFESSYSLNNIVFE